jgi:hypothetical protein
MGELDRRYFRTVEAAGVFQPSRAGTPGLIIPPAVLALVTEMESGRAIACAIRPAIFAFVANMGAGGTRRQPNLNKVGLNVQRESQGSGDSGSGGDGECEAASDQKRPET